MKKIMYFLMPVLCFMLLASGVKAVAPATLALTNTAGDNVRVTITGDPSSTIRLSFLPPGASTMTTIVFGTTDENGNFTTSISSGGYGIPQGSPVYITVNGAQSTTMLWPSYVSSLSLSSASVNIAVGQSVNITGSNTLILAANGISSVIGAILSGSQVTITGLSNGSGALSLCGANVGCGSIAVVVGDQGQNQITFSLNNFTLSENQTKNVNIYGGGNSGFNVASNSNAAAVEASISGTSNVISLYGGHTPGTATIVVCSKSSSTNCASLVITTLSSNVDALSFSPSSVTLNPGASQNVIISGGPDNSYYVSSNSDSAVAGATVSSNILTLIGGSKSGTSEIKVCSATTNATCGRLSVTLKLNTEEASATALSFSQNVVSISKTETTNVTVAGGGNSGYVISSNSNPIAVTANIASSTNIISIYGANVGSSIINICSVSSGSVCASIYVNVGSELVPINFSQNNVVITANNKSIISLSGGSGSGKVISLNSNPTAVAAALNGAGNVLTLSGGTASGSAVITICSSTYSTNCATINASYTKPAPVEEKPSSPKTNADILIATQTLIEKIIAEASDVIQEKGIVKDTALEGKIKLSYFNSLIKGKTLNAAATKLIINFITYGTATTKNMGAGERAGVLSSYKKAFNKLPTTESEWADAIKIANGRWPGEANTSAVLSAKIEFKKVYKREADLSNQNDNAAISIIAYGLRPTARNTNSERSAIKTFKAVYGHNPDNSLAWDIVRAVAYSGAKR
ncbi:MAG: hypothetical protein PHF50_02655 [Patescibacteria group bacterium]|nr:hypothetical protein [Patescibacteria group bacterium]